ncbi:DNA primase [Diplocloster agilis]|uniref:DNA primase n=1 Tax=Diplocloster agilis TaxID=2850323 RepID=A0A949NIS7_9FIRM|nr:DNA primase [Diplocloster agilis]MBU9738675.1 DNA primase [Diplocloster agilis]MBU9746737.1 DNA primase [Diplocloster agilis]
MYFSDELIEEVRMKNDIVDVISGYVKLQRRGSTYFGLCPFHNEKSPSFSVTPSKQMYYCFGCGAGGNVFTFLMEYENYTFPEALRMLAQRAGVELPQEEYSPEAKKQNDLRTALLEINKEAARYYYYQLSQKGGQAAHDYLTGRALTEETIRRFGLGYSTMYRDDLYRYLKKKGYSDGQLKESGLVTYDEKQGPHDKFWNRVMFPIMDVNHRVIGFGGRVMGEAKPKYLNSPETRIFDKSRNLYGLDIAKSSRKPSLLICEGYMDVIAMHQAGFTNAVASLGTALTTQHASLLKRYTQQVLLVYDSDGAGVKAAMRAIPMLKDAGLTAKVLNLRPYKDPDEFIKNLGPEAFKERIDQAQNSFMFELSVMEHDYDMDSPEGKTAFYRAAAEKLLEFSEEIERNNYIEAVAQKYPVGYENLRRLVNQMGLSKSAVQPRERPRQTAEKAKKKESGMSTSEKLLLTWLIEDPGLFGTVKDYVGAEDFTYALHRTVAQLLFAQFENGELKPAQIINRFEDPEEQREVAALFNATLKDVETKEEKEKALKETLCRIKRNSIEYRSDHMDLTDIAGLQRIIEDKRMLERMEKLHISWD